MMSTNEMTGGEALARMLAGHKGGPMFGMGGFQLLPFYDAARRLGLAHHLINDERAGVFAADAYAKVSGRVGLADATLGPGATNLVTGLVEALNAGTPMVVLVGDSHRAALLEEHDPGIAPDRDPAPGLQGADPHRARRAHPRADAPRLRGRDLGPAGAGRRRRAGGHLPRDAAVRGRGFRRRPGARGGARRCAAGRTAPRRARAAALLAEARRPLVLAGGGVHISGAADALTDFARARAIPVAHTMTGKGAIACTDPLSAGLFGRYDRIANALIEEADCLLVVGCKLGEIATKRYTVPPQGQDASSTSTSSPRSSAAPPSPRSRSGAMRAPASRICTRRCAGVASRPAAEYVEEVARRMGAWRESVAERYTSEEVPVSMARLMRRAQPR